ncbi:MAG: radical SAM family heme chaperone HemW [Clostridia bacterium]|nr:radical SAM family heme chaperone HemW [Clostridia bacterium]
MNKNHLGLYIHIPYCKSKCHYCDFNSFPGKEESIPGYFDALVREVELYAETLKEIQVKTIFIGGGTPSLVEPKYIYHLMRAVQQNLNIVKNAEISIETNPGTLTYEKLLAYKTMGINRLSIGLQACQDRLLRKLGRIHKMDEFVENYEIARKVGFKNINIDLIFGIPSQTMKDWGETLRNVIGLNPEHLSCYSLKIEEETKFGKMYDVGELIPVEDELDREMYEFTAETLKKNGYKHYEISNFAKEGFECRHNLIYWHGEEYMGIGAGAHSYYKKNRYNNLYNIEAYISQIEKKELPQENHQFIDAAEEMSEAMILGLRLIQGVHVKQFKEKFHRDLFEVYGEQINKLMKKGLLFMEDDHVKLTLVGLDLANDVFMEFI